MTRKNTSDTRIVEGIRAGADWITCTMHDGAPGRWEWSNRCVRVIQDIAEDGNALGDRGMLGYRGVAAGNCFFGTREDGAMLQLAGRYAGDHFQTIIENGLSVSRLDVAVTVQFKAMPSYIGTNAYRNAVDAVGVVSSKYKRRIYQMNGTDGGHTVYIGSPSSEERARLYNKEVQSENPDFARCWRYEVVLRNDAAQRWYDILAQVSQVSRREIALQLVVGWFQKRGIKTSWYKGADTVVLPIAKAKPSDAAKKLKWLEKQVAPAYKWLIENGYGDAANEAIGINKLYPTDRDD